MKYIMLKKALLFIFIVALMPSQAALARYYYGLGPNFILPQNSLNELNDESWGLNFHIESRQYCKLWIGLRADYIGFSKTKGLDSTSNYFREAILISPLVRYNFLVEDCYDHDVLPYVTGMLTISSIEDKKKRGRFGLGAQAGAGVTMGYTLFNKCWLLDLSAIWSAPNSISRADYRQSIQYVNLGLTISVNL